MHPELDAARAGIAAVGRVAMGALRGISPFLQSDIAEQPGEQRPMDGAVAFGLFRAGRRHRPPQLLERLGELRLDVAPLAHARVGKEILAADPPQAAFSLQLPKLQEAQKIRSLVGKPGVALVGRGGALERALARVPDRERGGDDAHLGEAAFHARRHQHARHARIEGKPRQLAPYAG